ncbi:hypothetical protein [Helicobacter cappadocius]|uniref:Lipoprotein n=1 Tax=Helicobacter cappadocius TaxID=3063998 RepID=A0AA90PYW8_9HELI|nr:MULTISPECIES: hypothetical protein [unclassified Helicobacter]MDO7253194.1 hypothetical protein [Helicobacter sp. faydin-H75]MDP2539118.1 hypothetical protein [Helicobacter sp. faydin-H76]
MKPFKIYFLVAICTILVFIGCAAKKPKPQTTYTTIKCETICKNNHCNQKCIGVEEVK